MKRNFGTTTLLIVILMATVVGCERKPQIPTMTGGDEESANRLTLTDTYDNVRNGAHLIISYNASEDAFIGTVTNTTNGTLAQVRVEVHLYDGTVTVDESVQHRTLTLCPVKRTTSYFQSWGNPLPNG